MSLASCGMLVKFNSCLKSAVNINGLNAIVLVMSRIEEKLASVLVHPLGPRSATAV